MSMYTAEDFTKASLASRGESGVARRAEPSLTHQWRAYGEGHGWFSDEEMVRDGWVPVVEGESSDRIETLLDTKKIHERVIRELRQDLAVARDEIVDLREERDRLSKQLAVSDEQIKSRRLVIEELMEENARLELILQEPLSLKDMRVAWDAAYEEAECHKGDVLVTRHSDDNYEVWVSVETFDISKKTRVLSHAPRPEPWKDLADVLGDFVIYDTDGSNVRAGEAAQFLYENGVRMAGGGDDE